MSTLTEIVGNGLARFCDRFEEAWTSGDTLRGALWYGLTGK